MKRVLLVACLCLAGCYTFRRSAEGIDCSFSEKHTDKELTVEATLTNNTGEAITLVQNPNFYTLSISAPRKGEYEELKVILMHYASASLSEVKTLGPDEKITFSETFSYKRGPKGELLILDFFSDEPSMIIRSRKIKAEFSYGYHGSYLPHIWHLFRRNIVDADLDFSGTLDAP